eukprot:1190174-Prorocentrum_minimum.AAC.4
MAIVGTNRRRGERISAATAKSLLNNVYAYCDNCVLLCAGWARGGGARATPDGRISVPPHQVQGAAQHCVLAARPPRKDMTFLMP